MFEVCTVRVYTSTKTVIQTLDQVGKIHAQGRKEHQALAFVWKVR